MSIFTKTDNSNFNSFISKIAFILSINILINCCISQFFFEIQKKKFWITWDICLSIIIIVNIIPFLYQSLKLLPKWLWLYFFWILSQKFLLSGIDNNKITSHLVWAFWNFASISYYKICIAQYRDYNFSKYEWLSYMIFHFIDLMVVQ